MTVYAHTTLHAAYRRVRENNIEHDQAVRAVAQAFVIDPDEVAKVCEPIAAEFDQQPQTA